MLCIIQYICTHIERDKCGEIKTIVLLEGPLGLMHSFSQLLRKPETPTIKTWRKDVQAAG